MRFRIAMLLFLFVVLSLVGNARAYDHAPAHALDGRFAGKVSRGRIDAKWVSPTTFWYRNRSNDGSEEYVVVDCEAGTRTVVSDRDELPKGEGSEGDTAEEYLQAWRPRVRQRHSPMRRTSPDGIWICERRDHNLWLRNKETDEEFQKTTDGVEGHSYEPRVFWSPDSTKFVAMQRTAGGDRRVYLVESSPNDQLQPKLDSYHYLKPGDEIPLRRPRLFSVGDAPEVKVSNELFDNPWAIDEVRWDDESQHFTFYYNQRGHQVARVLKVDAETGDVKTVVEDQQDTFIDYAHKHFAYYLSDTDELIWMSERDGWNHLYLIDLKTGAVKNQITSGDWVVRRVDYVDVENREVWFRAGGFHADQDPYYQHHCRVSFDGTGVVCMTAGDGTHNVSYSPDRKFMIDTYSRVDMPTVAEVRRTSDGTLVLPLEQASTDKLIAAGWQAPERFVAKARDGETDIYGVIFRPTDFDENRSYPVIEELYAGPQGSFVPKGFRAVHGSQKLAELGFIVVQIDGMGTSNRSKAFHDVCCKNLADAGFPDRKLWMQAAAQRYPQMDLSRVGVKGHSAGAQSAMGALLWHNDFYHVAIASCGCHDNRMDKIWWNELWMGWPIGPHYAEQSNVTNAHRLQGKLFLVVGEMDKNVDPASTMQVVDALVKADKDFDFLVVPGRGHNTSIPYVERRKWDFLIEHLGAKDVVPLQQQTAEALAPSQVLTN